jgi:hypothetical protein
MRRPRQESLWSKRESWIILFCVILVILMVIAAIGYMIGAWDQMPPS